LHSTLPTLIRALAPVCDYYCETDFLKLVNFYIWPVATLAGSVVWVWNPLFKCQIFLKGYLRCQNNYFIWSRVAMPANVMKWCPQIKKNSILVHMTWHHEKIIKENIRLSSTILIFESVTCLLIHLYIKIIILSFLLIILLIELTNKIYI
jgi:hypothetical protein